jgi:hypothetical protein
MAINNAKLSAPWYTYKAKVEALFEEDPDITVSDIESDEDGNYTFTVYSSKFSKYTALDKLLITDISLGNVSLHINVVYNGEIETESADLISDLFADNPKFNDVLTTRTPLGVSTYAVFNKEVLQYYSDDISDINGNTSTLAAEVSKEIFVDNIGVNFCTDSVDRRIVNEADKDPIEETE